MTEPDLIALIAAIVRAGRDPRSISESVEEARAIVQEVKHQLASGKPVTEMRHR